MTFALLGGLLTLALFVLFVTVHVLDRLGELEQRLEPLEEMAHPPVDVRTVVKAYARAEVERVLEEQVP